jgi:hypothetical protein
MLPALRLGFIVTPRSLRDAVHRAKYLTGLAHVAVCPDGAGALHRRGRLRAPRSQMGSVFAIPIARIGEGLRPLRTSFDG